MQADAAAMAAAPGDDVAPKVRLLTLKHLDGRTVAARRAAALAQAYVEELGGAITDAQRAGIETAAALSAIAEDCQARRLAGDTSITLNDLVRAISAARRARRDIGIGADFGKPKERPESLDEYMERIERERGGAGP